jgi:PII-like signaling protein
MLKFLAPGLDVINETDVKVLFIMSQLTPLHWAGIEPHETVHIDCGRVFFTVSADYYDESKVPTAVGTTARLATIAGATVLTGGVGLLVTGTISGMTSYEGIKSDGFYADGTKIFIKQRPVGESGHFELYFVMSK